MIKPQLTVTQTLLVITMYCKPSFNNIYPVLTIIDYSYPSINHHLTTMNDFQSSNIMTIIKITRTNHYHLENLHETNRTKKTIDKQSTPSISINVHQTHWVIDSFPPQRVEHKRAMAPWHQGLEADHRRTGRDATGHWDGRSPVEHE